MEADIDARYSGQFAGAAPLNKKLAMLWIAC
jgi:hypothetical protein